MQAPGHDSRRLRSMSVASTLTLTAIVARFWLLYW